MTRHVRFTAAAREDLRNIFDFIAEATGADAVGDAFTQEIRGRCRRLAELPGTLGSPRPELRSDLRSTPHRGYVILFRYRPDAVEIVNILHGSRDIAAHVANPEPDF
jgi:toxin ParE1/3/4